MKKLIKPKVLPAKTSSGFLESRLDNVVYRLGFASSRKQARQLIKHRHIIVNDSLVDIPSYILAAGDVVKIKDHSKKLDVIHNSLKKVKDSTYSWLSIDKASLSGTFITGSRKEPTFL